MENRSQHTISKDKIKSVNHALKLLNETAEESADEIRDMVTKDYENLKHILEGVKPAVADAASEIRSATSEALGQAREQVVTTAKETAQTIDDSAHHNPWAYIGGTALLATAVGYLLGRSSRGA